MIDSSDSAPQQKRPRRLSPLAKALVASGLGFLAGAIVLAAYYVYFWDSLSY
ncbi:hypothetical protein [Streptomyces sp. NPDC000410]|uniref:hypothetical protein n=1 Tax=Streptomyces sp. NPDC000410 TaxID=3154254 RepID=UPI00332AFF79